MEELKGAPDLLDLMVQPGFYVENFKIVQLNAAAEGLLLCPGMDIRPLIDSGLEEYASFQGGCLYLRLRLTQTAIGASIVKQNGMDIFLLDTQECDSALQALSLAARELRGPLAAITASADALQGEDAQLALLNRGIHQLLRILGNMSDAGRRPSAAQQETTEINALLSEVLEKAAILAEAAGVTIRYQGLEQPIWCLADREQLERAVLNLISNALKFSPSGGSVDVSLTRSGKMLRFSIRDNGPGFAQNLLGSVFNRYLRQPCIEEGRYGLGLGMVLVRTAAACHGGAVLIDQPDGSGARVTMTMAIRQNTSGMLRSPILRVDYAGEQDHTLVELADCLPADLYKKET